jgi:three-Cys-motif partner protein
MAGDDFHNEPFDEGTLTKLDIYQLYTREWLPVFLAKESEYVRAVHLFDFFAGPGTDATGVFGSPLRTLEVLKEYSRDARLHAWGKVPITAHFYDATRWKAKKLKAVVESDAWRIPGVTTRTERADFEAAFAEAEPILSAKDAAKLVLLDQFGVSEVTPDVFRKLVSYPRTDFLFFISSTTLHRFRAHPNIQQKIRPTDDFNQVHHAVLEHYREMLPVGRRYYLAPFSIKKGANIYGIIFGSAHPRGMDKFLTVAWEKDRLNGNANFDINHDDLRHDELMLDLGRTTRPSKINAFEDALEHALRTKRLPDEVAVMDLCYSHGVQRRHATPVLQRLKKEGVIALDFHVPTLEHLKEPRIIRYR